jgi:hypothetical protein
VAVDHVADSLARRGASYEQPDTVTIAPIVGRGSICAWPKGGVALIVEARAAELNQKRQRIEA